MRRFVIYILLFVGVPFIFVLGFYCIVNPFHNVGKFIVDDCNATNREYVSTELLLRNNKTYHYNSFVFGSSRACSINTYQWKSKLDTNASQFLFQAWSESITGIYQKIIFLNKNHIPINNTLILIEIPGTFSKEQEPKTVLQIKHYMLSGESKIVYYSHFLKAILKPSEIYKLWNGNKNNPSKITIDTITNDWNIDNKKNWNVLPLQDSISSNNTIFYLDKKYFPIQPKREQFSNRLINSKFSAILDSIKTIFDIQKTNFKIIITPDYSQLHINAEDLLILQSIFGKANVYNYSGKNAITSDKYNFKDPGHFDTCVGWQLINETYKNTKHDYKR